MSIINLNMISLWINSTQLFCLAPRSRQIKTFPWHIFISDPIQFITQDLETGCWEGRPGITHLSARRLNLLTNYEHEPYLYYFNNVNNLEILSLVLFSITQEIN